MRFEDRTCRRTRIKYLTGALPLLHGLAHECDGSIFLLLLPWLPGLRMQ